MSSIAGFKISKLHGYKDFVFEFTDNKLILIGENGSGKSTALRLLYYFLNLRWDLIASYKFESLDIFFSNGSAATLQSSSLIPNIKHKNFLRRFPPSLRKKIQEFATNFKEPDPEQIKLFLSEYGMPSRYIFDFMELPDLLNSGDAEKLTKIEEVVKNEFKSSLLYLPTYRRIEQDLHQILKGKGYDDERLYKSKNPVWHEEGANTSIELIEFGMQDVEDGIQITLESLRKFALATQNKLTLGYLGDVVNKTYEHIDVEIIKNISEQDLRGVLNRIDTNILSQDQKDNICSIINSTPFENEHSKLLGQYLLKLLDFKEQIEDREISLVKFFSVCNEYLVDKQFCYNSSDFSYTIKSLNKDEESIQLKQLSSGEKQIISLFSHLYLGKKKKYFVLIDEPELSLSVTWQKKFLVDIEKSEFCSGFMAVTHSPFIYANELKDYARALGEFEV